MARATTGTLIRKVDCQLKLSSSMPAISGPAAMAIPAEPDHKVIALARSARGKVAARRERGGHDERRADTHHGTGGDDFGPAVDE